MQQSHILQMQLPFEDARLTLGMGRDGFVHRDRWDAGSHSNTDYEIHILLAGSCGLEVSRRQVEVASGHGILIRRGVYHHPCRLSDDFSRFTFNVMPATPQEEERLFGFAGDFVVFPVSRKDLALCGEIFNELEKDAPFRRTALGALFSQLLVGLFRRICPALEAPEPESRNAMQNRSVVIDRFFAAWLHPCGTETELAKQLNLSRRQLGRVLREHYGMSFREKQQQSRMEYAGSLLRTTDWKIAEISRRVGYGEAAAFFKAFRGYYHMSPGQYRRQLGSKTERQEELT